MKHLVTATALAIVLSTTNVRAASFTCGVTMCRIVGISQAQCKKLGLPLALMWAKKFRRVSSPAPGLVLVQVRKGKALGGSRGGHVSRIVSLTDNPCRAVVRDNRGQYVRDICKNRVAFVSVGGMWTE